MVKSMMRNETDARLLVSTGAGDPKVVPVESSGRFLEHVRDKHNKKMHVEYPKLNFLLMANLAALVLIRCKRHLMNEKYIHIRKRNGIQRLEFW